MKEMIDWDILDRNERRISESLQKKSNFFTFSNILGRNLDLNWWEENRNDSLIV